MRSLKLWFMTIEICLGSLFMLSSCAKSTASEETMNETSESHSGVWAASMTDSEKTDDSGGKSTVGYGRRQYSI